MSQNPAAKITIDQLRNREIVAADLLQTVAVSNSARGAIINAPSEPLSVFGRKIVGHDS